MTVVDASVVVAALVGEGPMSRWAEEVVADRAAVAPHLLPVEVANILRRLVASGSISGDNAALALDDLADLALPLHEFLPLADRVWELRDNVTSYDAWYVALAEELETPLATLDRRLSAAPGPACAFLTPPDRG